MSDIAIHCEGLSKSYQLGKQESYRALRDTIADTLTAPARYAKRLFAGNPIAEADAAAQTLWALKDVSFDIKHGEVVGIIGRNGAGKSTLLKILSRITKPTSGGVTINGRVGSLLEVGTGFHPELTGRENIFLNGAILGMKRAEIKRNFDEIVAFAEIEKFIDTPVKRYSSGMYVRLAFAVAVHLEPEILVVDEVLAVGDAQFQKKCLNKMQEIGRGGRTIFFVSHNMAAIRSICQSGVSLEAGRVVDAGEVNQVVDEYLTRTLRNDAGQVEVETPSFTIRKVEIKGTNESPVKTFAPLEIRINFTAKTNIGDPGLYIGILSNENQRIAGLDFKDFRTIPAIRAGETIEMGFLIEANPFLPGNYLLEIHLKDMAAHKVELVPKVFPWEVVETPVYGGRKTDIWYGQVGLKAQAMTF